MNQGLGENARSFTSRRARRSPWIKRSSSTTSLTSCRAFYRSPRRQALPTTSFTVTTGYPVGHPENCGRRAGPIIQMFHTLAHMKNSVAQSEAEKKASNASTSSVRSWLSQTVGRGHADGTRTDGLALWGGPEKISVVPCESTPVCLYHNPGSQPKSNWDCPRNIR